jgi:anti-sigma factor RsiW
MSNLFPHIPFSRLVDLAEGRLHPAERARLEAHLAACTACSGEVAQLEHLIWLMRTDASEDAPLHVIDRAMRLFDSQAERVGTACESALSGLRRHVQAVLRFDSLGLAPAFGVRSGEPSARQLLFSAWGLDIDLRLEPADQAWTVSGQVLGVATAGGRAVLQGAVNASQATLNEQGEFTMTPVPAGDYQLFLHLVDVDIEVDELIIGT